jgi:hypothetical protein
MNLLASARLKSAFLTTLAAVLMSGPTLAAEVVLRHGPGGVASLVNSSLDTSVVLMSYSITGGDQGVDLLPAGWDSFQSQGQSFLETSATVDLLAEAAVTGGLLFAPGQSRSIGVPFNLRADADGDGAIDLADFAIWKQHDGQLLQGPAFGDFDINGIVDLDDFNILSNELGNSAVYTFSATTTVPEPSSLLLTLAFGGALSPVICRLRSRRPT